MRASVFIGTSVDGFIEAPDGNMAWFETADEYADGVAGEDPEEFLKTIDCYVMGGRPTSSRSSSAGSTATSLRPSGGT